MFEKAIPAREIEIGDKIDTGRGFRGKVLKHLGDDSGGKHFLFDFGRLCFLSDTIVGLLYRPYRPGQTELSMRNQFRIKLMVLHALYAGTKGGKEADEQELTKAENGMQEAWDAYRLGKQIAGLASEELNPAEPVRNESLVDRHMMP